MPLIGTGIGSAIGNQDVFEGLLGYSIKREYLGESFNYRNVETFTYDIYVTDLSNSSTDPNTGTCSIPAHNNDQAACKTATGTWTPNPTMGRNYLSTFIRNTVSNLLNVDKQNINVTSIDVPNSEASKENLITLGTYRVTFEVRQKIEDDVMWEGYCDGAAGANAAACAANGGAWKDAQHEELDPALANSSRFRNVQKVFEDYGEHVNNLTESIDIERGTDGSKTISHNVSMDARDGLVNGVQTQAKLIAQGVAYDLLSCMNFTKAWGINMFKNADKDFGFVNKFLSQKNNRFVESYDLLANKYTFTRKTKVLADETGLTNAGFGAKTKKYSQNAKVSIQMSEAGDFTLTEDLEIVSQTSDLKQVKKEIKTIKEAVWQRCEHLLYDWVRNRLGILGSLTTPPTIDTLQDEFVKTTCTTNIDERSRTVTISTTFTNANLGGSTSPYEVDTTVVLEKDMKGVNSLDFSVDLKLTDDKYDTKRDVIEQQSQNLDKKDHIAGPTFHKDIVGALYEFDLFTPNYVLEHYHNDTPNSVDLFWKSNPNLLDFRLDGEIVTWGEINKTIVPNPTEWTLLNKNATSKTRGKAYSLKKKWTDDPVYIKSLPGCVNCFKKIEPKITDTYPKNTFNEHVIPNRGELISKGKVLNKANTSILNYAYNSSPGKRSVVLNAVIPRRKWNILLPSESLINEKGGAYVPVQELKSLAAYARVLLMEVFFDKERLNGTHFVAHLSGLSYTFDSSNNLTLSAEVTYGYKQYNPSFWQHMPMKYKK